MISLKNITHRYNPKESAGLKDVSLEFKSPGLYSIIGPSGSGKTTLLKIINGDIEKFQGQIEIKNNSKVNFQKSSDLKIFNDPKKRNLNALDFLCQLDFEEDLTETRIINKARDLLMHFEITHTISRPVKSLSHGEQQRLLVSSIFMKDRKIVLFDECFIAMDWLVRNEVLNLIKEYAFLNELYVIWATQLVDTALIQANSIALFYYGELQQFGTPKDIFEKSNSPFVAQFTGVTNIINYTKDKDYIKTNFGEFKIREKFKVEPRGFISLRPNAFQETKEDHEIQTEIKSSVFHKDFYLNKTIDGLIFYSVNQIKEFSKVKLKIDWSLANFIKEKQ